MPFCPKCGFDGSADDAFCRKCGHDLAMQGSDDGHFGTRPPEAAAPARPRVDPRRKRLITWIIVASILLDIPLVIFFLNFKGCSSTEGSFVAAGAPLGDFTFTAAQCRSGQRMSVNGVVLVGKGQTDGGLMIVDDPVNGKLVKVEVPGSCKPPDYEVCTEVTVRPPQCKTFDLEVHSKNVVVNDIRLFAGHLRLDCAFPEGGTARADLVFDSCD